jgi:sortase family protein
LGRVRRRIAGFRVVMSWPDTRFAPPSTKHPRPGGLRSRVAGMAGALLLVGGATAVGVAVAAQQHAPQPSLAAAGATGPSGKAWWLSLRHSLPVSIEIPAIGVHSALLHLGLKPGGAMQVPPLQRAGVAAWYKYSVTPGQIGTAVIEGHVDTKQGPAVFFRLGALRPGDLVNVRLADGVTAVFRITGVRQYLKSKFPAKTVYRDATRFAALRLITCGGGFDYATSQYLSSTVVYAFLVTSRPAAPHKAATRPAGGGAGPHRRPPVWSGQHLAPDLTALGPGR